RLRRLVRRSGATVQGLGRRRQTSPATLPATLMPVRATASPALTAIPIGSADRCTGSGARSGSGGGGGGVAGLRGAFDLAAAFFALGFVAGFGFGAGDEP